jgi:L-fuculose-phosphate aldolase
MANEAEVDEAALRAEMVRVGRLLYERGLTVANDGNLSARLGEGWLLTTPAGSCKGMLEPGELVVVDMAGRPRDAGQRPSSELLLHLHVYRRRPDVQAVVHAHPPLAVACTLAGVSLEEPLLPEVIVLLGRIPTAPYARTGTAAMGEAIDALIAHHDAMLLDHHGSLTAGKTLLQAFLRTEQIEQAARILITARMLGGARPLPPGAVGELLELRRAMGFDPGAEPPLPSRG